MTVLFTLQERLEATAEQAKPLEALALDDFLGREFPPREQLLHPWLPAKGLAMVFAPRGVGKTHFALAVAYAVASGGTYLKWSAPKPRKVLLLDGEMPASSLQERLAEIVQNAPAEAAGDYVRVLAADLCESGLPDISTVHGQEQLEPHLQDAELIIVDNISTICRSGKENESESWGTVQGWALAQRRAGRSVLFVHHAGKGGEQRGTSKREDVVDTVIKLDRPDDYSPADGARFVVTFTKSRGFLGRDAEPFEAMLREGVWSTRNVEEGQAELAAKLKSEGMTQREIGSELGCSASTVNRLLRSKEER